MTLRLSLLSLRIAIGLQAVLMFAQAASAGGFLGGHFDLLAIHGTLGRALTVVTLLTTVAAFFVRRLGGPRSVFPVSAVMVVALVGQIALGIAHSVAAHVLLGVTLVSAGAVLAHQVLTTPLPSGAEVPEAAAPVLASDEAVVEPEPSR